MIKFIVFINSIPKIQNFNIPAFCLSTLSLVPFILQGLPDSIRQFLTINNQSIQQHTGKYLLLSIAAIYRLIDWLLMIKNCLIESGPPCSSTWSTQFTYLHGCKGDVMVEKLCILHQHKTISVVEVADICVDHCRHQTWGWQGTFSHRVQTWSIHIWKYKF
jgi:hypothetical protein